MKPEEFQYIERAMEALGGTMTIQARIKVMRTMSQILERDAQRLEQEFMDRVDDKLARNFQDRQNQKLVDILSS